MGMTDKQFDTHLRMVIKDIKETINIQDVKEKDRKLKELLDLLQTSLEN